MRVGLAGAEHILVRYGSRIDSEGFCPQDCVETFIRANEAWAMIATEPIPYSNVDSEDHRAWAAVGQLVFWINRRDVADRSERIAFLCDELMSVPAALPDIRHLARFHKWTETQPVLTQLTTRFGESIGRALLESLEHDGHYTSAFRGAEFFQNEIFHQSICILAIIGTRETIDRLRPLTDHPSHGLNVIQAIEEIEKRLAAAHEHQNESRAPRAASQVGVVCG